MRTTNVCIRMQPNTFMRVITVFVGFASLHGRARGGLRETAAGDLCSSRRQLVTCVPQLLTSVRSVLARDSSGLFVKLLEAAAGDCAMCAVCAMRSGCLVFRLRHVLRAAHRGRSWRLCHVCPLSHVSTV